MCIRDRVNRFSLRPIFQSSSQLSPKDVPSAVRSPAIFFPVDGSKISPSALTATTAAIRRSPNSTAYIPRPDFIARSMPQILPTVAPVPAPTLPQDCLLYTSTSTAVPWRISYDRYNPLYRTAQRPAKIQKHPGKMRSPSGDFSFFTSQFRNQMHRKRCWQQSTFRDSGTLICKNHTGYLCPQ